MDLRLAMSKLFLFLGIEKDVGGLRMGYGGKPTPFKNVRNALGLIGI